MRVSEKVGARLRGKAARHGKAMPESMIRKSGNRFSEKLMLT
jgi:hypothetical protein